MKYLFFILLFFLSGCDEKIASNNNLPPLPCDLNSQICENSGLSFEILPRPAVAMQKHKILIKNLKDLKDPKIIFTGINMYMGEISAPLKKDANGTYSATFMLSSCILSIMRYHAEIYDGEKPTGKFIEFDVKKQSDV
ncbi:hypothetical protein [Campylobacter hominis]|uniref:Putative periplasmic protein n=1 Tax=Campylobacter hominis (strain ATCC BAA-381 / DSM 21671 / CCUG 45161 / LMG 19568 / NCTC 13146 / CH001A) TaxID=360107 RepID=A7HZG6_CAMHC|nr:hypothetical protein [Campylobacter hominis]ABS51917.1 putative periplasmic protein [Campylobacter hominis ATCC BAA-381]UAK85478.1 hypothetical protein K8O82_06365 [Campylobacter hominis]SUW84206.1 putative periplasmic protein [Campylobacter hominis]